MTRALANHIRYSMQVRDNNNSSLCEDVKIVNCLEILLLVMSRTHQEQIAWNLHNTVRDGKEEYGTPRKKQEPCTDEAHENADSVKIVSTIDVISFLQHRIRARRFCICQRRCTDTHIYGTTFETLAPMHYENIPLNKRASRAIHSTRTISLEYAPFNSSPLDCNKRNY